MKPPIYIKRINSVSKEIFYSEYVKKSKPVVITDLASGWEAHSLWTFNYMQEQYGESVVQAYKLKANGHCEVDIKTGSATQPALLYNCIQSFDNALLETKCAVASPVELFSRQLVSEFSPPEYCADGKFLRSMIFIGPKGVISPLHQDLPENLYVMVKGVKRLILFSPFDDVYPNSRLSNLPNHSQIDAENPDYEKFPLLKNVQPYIVDLKAGETLFIPSLWWHYLRNLEPGIALNFWWNQGWKLPIAWAAAMYKKYRKI